MQHPCFLNIVFEFSGAANSSTSEATVAPQSTLRLPPSVPFIPPYPFSWPLPFPVAPMLPRNSFPFQESPFNGKYYNTALMGTHGIPFEFLGTMHKNNVSSLKLYRESDIIESQKSSSFNKMASSSTSCKETMPVIKFFKPNNMYEYNILLEAAKDNPKDFPEILRNEKTKFLSGLGIVPKSICSKKSLKKFRREHRCKKLLNRECIIYRERKTLRDRNKLLKPSYDKKCPYLMQGAIKHPSMSSNSTCETVLGKRNTSDGEDGIRKKIKMYNPIKKNPIEIIDIASSDDETQKENNSPNKNIIKHDKQNLQTKSGQLSEFPESGVPKSSSDKQLNHSVNEEKKHLETYKDRNEKNTSAINETTQHILTSANTDSLKELPINSLNAGTFPQLNGIMNSSTNIKPLNAPRCLAIKQIQGLPESRPQMGYTNAIDGLGNAYIISPINPVTIGLRQTSSSLVQQSRKFGILTKNSLPRNIYPASVSKVVSNPNLFFIDKQQKGALYVIPHLPRTTPAENFQKAEPSAAISTSKSCTVPHFVSSSIPEQQQQRTGSDIKAQHQNGMNKKASNKGKNFSPQYYIKRRVTII